MTAPTSEQPLDGGVQPTPAPDDIYLRRHDVIAAALRLAATEWGNGRLTASDSMDLDFAQDRLDEALAAYVKAANDTPKKDT